MPLDAHHAIRSLAPPGVSALARFERAYEKSARENRRRVYFILRPASSIIKVGVSVNPARRLAALRTASGDALIMLGHVSGGCQIEAMIHRLLANFRFHGEWFHDCDAVRLLIAGFLLEESRR